MTESLLEFPCEVTVKAMGLASDSLEQQVAQLVTAHLDDPKSAVVTTKQSSKGKYSSVSVTFLALDQPHLEAVYADLNACDDVVFTL